jgi:hypothetical protein
MSFDTDHYDQQIVILVKRSTGLRNNRDSWLELCPLCHKISDGKTGFTIQQF